MPSMTAPWPSLIRLTPSAQMRMPDGFNEGWIAFPANGERMGMVKGAIRLADVVAGPIAGAGA